MMSFLRRLLGREKQVDEHESELSYCGIVAAPPGTSARLDAALGLRLIHLRVAIDEYELLEVLAAEEGLIVQAYVRNLVIAHLAEKAKEPKSKLSQEPEDESCPVATFRGCKYGPNGPNYEIQCVYCGNPPPGVEG
jgi:hypothetical protein